MNDDLLTISDNFINQNSSILYHGGSEPVKNPEIRKVRYTKDFGVGFYCTKVKTQAEKWSIKRTSYGYISSFIYTPNPKLLYKKFNETDEWLDFVFSCRRGLAHDYDIVEGPMADDQIWNEIDDFIDGVISREAFWVLIKFTKPTHQISFHTENALPSLRYYAEEVVSNA